MQNKIYTLKSLTAESNYHLISTTIFVRTTPYFGNKSISRAQQVDFQIIRMRKVDHVKPKIQHRQHEAKCHNDSVKRTTCILTRVKSNKNWLECYFSINFTWNEAKKNPISSSNTIRPNMITFKWYEHLYLLIAHTIWLNWKLCEKNILDDLTITTWYIKHRDDLHKFNSRRTAVGSK